MDSQSTEPPDKEVIIAKINARTKEKLIEGVVFLGIFSLICAGLAAEQRKRSKK